MHTSSLRTAIYGVLFASLTAATGDIALSQFTPRINNLPSTCQAVYTSKIDGCVSSDFAAGAICSAACLAGLAKIGAAVQSDCASVDVGETSIIGVFQNNFGTAALCPNTPQPATTSSSTSASTSSTPRSSLQTSTSTSTSAQTSTSTSTSAQTSTSTSTIPASTTASPASSSPVSSSSLATATSSSRIAADTTMISTASTDPTAAPTTSSTHRANSQLSNPNSGGGSPFDVVATGGAGRVRTRSTRLLSALAVVVVLAWT